MAEKITPGEETLALAHAGSLLEVHAFLPVHFCPAQATLK